MTCRTWVHYSGVWDEWQPVCICGWQGTYWFMEIDAEAQAEMHRAEVEP